MRFKTQMLLMWLAACLLLVSACLVEYLREAHQIERSIRESEADRVKLFSQLFGQDFRGVAIDVRMLTHNEALRDFFASGRPAVLAQVTRQMALVSRYSQDYDQVRFLDESGRERVRVDYGGHIVPAAELQRKADRPYFREALALPAGQIYLSAFDLNVENGVVERPFKPMLRFAAPVFDAAGRRRGVVVINYLGARILDRFSLLAPLYRDRLRLLNDRGYWLRDAHAEDEWGFMLPARAGRTLAATAPAVWEQITAHANGESRGLGGLFTWRKVTPAKAVSLTDQPVRAADESLVIASDVAAATWNQAFFPLRLRFTIFAVALLLLTTAGSFLFHLRKRAVQRLGAAHRRNTALIRAANIAVVATTLDGVITDCNPMAERLFGWSASELIGRRTLAVFSDAEQLEARAEELSAEFGRIIAPGFDVFALKARRDGVEERAWIGVRKDGHRLPLWLSTSLLRDSLGRVAGYLGVISDMTAHKQAEQTLREASVAAEESVRLKARFLANMSHEIRTPMNGIIGMTELLLDTTLTDDQRMFADTVRTSADSLLTIINDILDFSKIEAGRLTVEAQPFDLVEPVETCLAIMAERAGAKGLELAYRADGKVPERLVGDSGRIGQVLLNLVGNAIKFTADGEVIVSVTMLSQEDRRARLRFAVRDTGLGISAEQRAKLFQPFVQVDIDTTRKFGGTGLGLAISKQLIGLMHGEIGLESELDKGSTFWFTLELPIADAESKTGLHPAKLAGRRALVVDDNKTNREILRRQLAAWNIDSTTVSDGEQALSALRSARDAGAPFDLAVLDMFMPGLTGLETARRVHSDPSCANLKMIVLTSIGHTLKRQELDDAGVGSCLVKPVRQSQFHDTLVTLLGGGSLAETAVPARREQPSSPSGSGLDLKLRILVAEDNPVNQLVARRQLEKTGHQPDIVANGAKAFEAVRSHPYDVVFMDCQMPELDGFEATGRIREWEKKRRAQGETVVPLYIVAMTANSMAGDREACLAAGMNDYVSKPLHRNDFAAALARSPAAQRQTEAGETSLV
jgi:PAS domain S-box-containing protein